MTTSHDGPAKRPERKSDQPLAEINKTEARDRKPDPELGKHGPLVGEGDGNRDKSRGTASRSSG